MKQCNHAIDGFRSGLSPSARPFAVGSSSLAFTASKSEHEDSLWGDLPLDLSFLSSDDQKSVLDDDDSLSNLSRDVDATKEVQLFEEKIASSGNVLVNPNPFFSELPKLLIKSSKVAVDDNLDLSCANTTVMSQKTSTNSDAEDSEVDSPCWRGINSHKTLPSGFTSRRSTDDLTGVYRLNPLAPQFIPSSSKKNIETDGRKCEEETSSSSLKKSLSSNFPSSSGEFTITDLPQDGISDAARMESILTNADESLGFVTQDSDSKMDSRNEFQISKKLDPLAPVFVPSSAKLSPSVQEKQGALETISLPLSPLTSSDNKSLNKVKVVISSADGGHSFKSRYGVHEVGSTSSYPSFESNGGIAKLGSSGNKSHGQRRLNPLAPQFSLAATKPKAYADDMPLEVNSAGLSSPFGYRDHNVADADLAQSSLYVERLQNMSNGGSLLISSKADNEFGSTKRFLVEPTTTLSLKEYGDLNHAFPFHVVETASSSYGQGHNSSAPSSSPKVDVKKLLTTMHGLSELLPHAHGSESTDSPNAQEHDLINSIVQNLNLYIKTSIEGQAGNQSVVRHSSYDLKLLPNNSKLPIRDFQLPRANNMTVDLDVKRKEKYSVVSGEAVTGSASNSFGQVVAKSGYQPNDQGEKQVNPNALFYKSLWLKAEAERCLMVYETCLSNPDS